MLHSIYHYLGYEDKCEDEITPDDKIVRQRHLLMKQIRNSKLKLKSINTPVKLARSETYCKSGKKKK